MSDGTGADNRSESGAIALEHQAWRVLEGAGQG